MRDEELNVSDEVRGAFAESLVYSGRTAVRLAMAVLLLLSGVLQPANGQESAVIFDGETYVRKHSEKQSSGDRMVQFVREPETLENWTRAIGYYRFAAMGDDPARAARELRENVRAANPDAQSRLVVDPAAVEATVDFLTWPPDGRYMEFSVFRYARSADGRALVAFQFACRFRDATKGQAEQFGQSRLSWRNQAAAFDMARVRAALE